MHANLKSLQTYLVLQSLANRPIEIHGRAFENIIYNFVRQNFVWCLGSYNLLMICVFAGRNGLKLVCDTEKFCGKNGI